RSAIDSKVASVVPLKKLLDVKLRELPSIAGCALREVTSFLFAGYYWYYNKYFNMKKGSVAGLSMVPAAYVLFNYCHSYKELSESLGLLCLWWGFP
uniref:ATP synthase F(0) complex subunit f, mitochondrial n=1 Tax=Phocoena sinus TaxID=42100 RepID=A0A8C9E8Y7_PHOSS